MIIFFTLDAVKLSSLIRIMPIKQMSNTYLYEGAMMVIYTSYLILPPSLSNPSLAILGFTISLKCFLCLKIFKEFRIFMELLNSVIPDMKYFVVV